MEGFKNRLLKYIEAQKVPSIRAFEEKCGLTNGTINSIGTKGPGAWVVQKISYAYPSLNLNWLFTGNGSMRIDGTPSSTAKQIPLLPAEAFAGRGGAAYSDESIEEYYVVSEFRNSDFLIRVKGDSMVPKYNGGDIVACKVVPLNNVYYFQWGRIYVIYTNSQGVMIKRVQPGEKKGYITLVSDNPKYAPFQVPVSDISSIALVNGAVTIE